MNLRLALDISPDGNIKGYVGRRVGTRQLEPGKIPTETYYFELFVYYGGNPVM